MTQVSVEGRLRLAIAIVSGRKTSFDSEDYLDLGYDPYRFGYYGTPSLDDVKEKAESILYNAIMERSSDK